MELKTWVTNETNSRNNRFKTDTKDEDVVLCPIPDPLNELSIDNNDRFND